MSTDYPRAESELRRALWPKLLHINSDLTNTERLEAYAVLKAVDSCFPHPPEIVIARPGYTIRLSGLLADIDSIMLNVVVMRVRPGDPPPYPTIAEARYRFHPSRVTIDTEAAFRHLVVQLVKTGEVLLGVKLYAELIEGCERVYQNKMNENRIERAKESPNTITDTGA